MALQIMKSLSLMMMALASAQAHFSIWSPCIMNSDNPACKGWGKIDYNLAAPTGQAHQYDDKEGVTNLNGGVCRTMPDNKYSATWASGSSNQIVFANHGSHKGGYCEWAASYNGGKTFVSFQFEPNCLTNAPSNGGQYKSQLKLPVTLPGGNVIISWTWVNKEGFREFYWNCMRINLTGSKATSFTGPPLAIFNFAFKHNGKTMAYVLPEFTGTDDAKNYANYFTSRPKITISGTKVSGGAGSIFPINLEGAKGLKASYSSCVYIKKGATIPALGGQTSSTSAGTKRSSDQISGDAATTQSPTKKAKTSK